jgi:hypothetical protein
MNERVLELAREVWPDPNISHVNHMKFAELVIKESINVVNRRYMGDNNREDMEVRRCVEDLKKHFGVEE